MGGVKGGMPCLIGDSLAIGQRDSIHHCDNLEEEPAVIEANMFGTFEVMLMESLNG